MTFKKIITLIFLIIIAIVAICFMVANRTMVSVAFDPFHAGNPSLVLNAPLFIWLFVFLFLGIFIGAVTVWITQHKYRKALRQREDEVAKLRHIADSKTLALQ